VTNPLERLDAAYDEVLAASGPDFLRRLAEYVDLFKMDKTIKAAVEGVRQVVNDADAALIRQDQMFVAELVPIRNRLVERAPEVDDSDRPWPGPYNPFDQSNARAFHKWTWTLANFDAVAEDRDEKMVEKRDLDRSRSRMLVAILEAKLHDLVFPFNEKPAPRPDLMDLWDETAEIGHSQVDAYQHVERVANESGYFALLHIEEVASRVEPKPRSQLKTPDQKRELLEEALRAPDLMRIPEMLRPEVARGPLSQEEREALDRIETACRRELERLHRPLRKRAEEGRKWKPLAWKGLVGRISWVPPMLGFIVDLVGFAVLVVVAAGFIADRF
jgi:hypothetical protein